VKRVALAAILIAVLLTAGWYLSNIQTIDSDGGEEEEITYNFSFEFIGSPDGNLPTPDMSRHFDFNLVLINDGSLGIRATQNMIHSSDGAVTLTTGRVQHQKNIIEFAVYANSGPVVAGIRTVNFDVEVYVIETGEIIDTVQFTSTANIIPSEVPP